jgi:uncharacterized protein YbjQ (UPF0145 family)
MKMILSLPILFLAALTTGCANYRTDSNVSFDSTKGVSNQSNILILETGYSDNNYTSLGKISGEVKKLTVFNKDPTKEQVNVVLSEKAKALGADAVINVVYKSGIGMTTWGYMEGTGEAIKINK